MWFCRVHAFMPSRLGATWNASFYCPPGIFLRPMVKSLPLFCGFFFSCVWLFVGASHKTNCSFICSPGPLRASIIALLMLYRTCRLVSIPLFTHLFLRPDGGLPALISLCCHVVVPHRQCLLNYTPLPTSDSQLEAQPD